MQARAALVAAALIAGTAAALAQGGPGPGAGRGAAGYWGPDYTPGWSLMTPQEREAHRAQMRSAATYEECRRIADAHHARMADRAKERGASVPPAPRRDPCAGLKR
jgi:hypothetical protein